MPFHVDGAERAGRAEVFACAAADAAFGIDHGNLARMLVVRVGRYHLYGACGAVAGAVAAFYVVCQDDAVFFYPDGMAYLGG